MKDTYRDSEPMDLPRIIELDISDPVVQQQILQLQGIAYGLEEELIGFSIPRTDDTVEDLLDSGEIFLGMVQDDELLGLVSFAADEDTMDIHRVAVDPGYFRQGVASELLQFLFEVSGTVSRFLVTTGASNLPAIGLYEKLGFIKIETFEPVPGLRMCRLERND